MLLSAEALGRIVLGIVLLVAFSEGVAVVLMSMGMAAVWAFRYVPVLSASLIVCVGLAMTALLQR